MFVKPFRKAAPIGLTREKTNYELSPLRLGNVATMKKKTHTKRGCGCPVGTRSSVPSLFGQDNWDIIVQIPFSAILRQIGYDKGGEAWQMGNAQGTRTHV